MLLDAGKPISHVYFPETAVVSLVVPIDKRKCVEVAIVGKEGIVGLPVALDDHHQLLAIAQIPGRLFRVETDPFPLTHQFLAQMLGVRRPTVSDAAARLQLDGLISYKRGWITIRDRGQLEKRACSCYQVLSQEMSRLLQ